LLAVNTDEEDGLQALFRQRKMKSQLQITHTPRPGTILKRSTISARIQTEIAMKDIEDCFMPV
jgi:hypothetical protein